MTFLGLHIGQGPKTNIYLSATDLAGNRTDAGFAYHIRPKRFKSDTVTITDKYLKRKMPALKIEGAQQEQIPLIEKFVLANSGLRQDNFQKVAELGNRSTKDLHWKGAFLRLPKSARMSGFGDNRDYRYNGHVIDRQVHLGIDLASVARSGSRGQPRESTLCGNIGHIWQHYYHRSWIGSAQYVFPFEPDDGG